MTLTGTPDAWAGEGENERAMRRLQRCAWSQNPLMSAIIPAERPDTADARPLIDELQTHLESFYTPRAVTDSTPSD